MQDEKPGEKAHTPLRGQDLAKPELSPNQSSSPWPQTSLKCAR